MDKNKTLSVRNIIYFAGAMLLLGLVYLGIWTFKLSSAGSNYLYHGSMTVDSEVVRLTWQQLMPEHERELLQKYAKPANLKKSDLSEDVFQALVKAADSGYQNAMTSAQTTAEYNDKFVEIPGFIVPIEFYENNAPSLIFIVPYYGACIHYPPPPPNQMIFARLEPSSLNVDLERPYLLRGVFKEGMFEDVMGTSAYQLDLINIQYYQNNPDDLRRHES